VRAGSAYYLINLINLINLKNLKDTFLYTLIV